MNRAPFTFRVFLGLAMGVSLGLASCGTTVSIAPDFSRYPLTLIGHAQFSKDPAYALASIAEYTRMGEYLQGWTQRSHSG